MKLLSVLLILTSLNVFANQHKNVKHKHALDFFGGKTLPVASSMFDDFAASGIGVMVNYRRYFCENLSFGGGISHLTFDNKDFSDTVGHLLLTYDFRPGKSFNPFLSIGPGFAEVRGDGFYESEAAGVASLGARWAMSEEVDFNAVINYYYIGEGDFTDQSIVAPMIGFTIRFGGEEKMSEGPMKASGPKDEDKDGIVDSEDQCPGTDKDVSVNVFGCEVDSDVAIRLDVKFAIGKADLDASYTEQLDALGKTLSENEEINIEVQGHTDNTGAEAFNNLISQKRAEAVKNYLIQNFSIEEKRISAKGFGPSKPIADNSTRTGRKENRRVEVFVK